MSKQVIVKDLSNLLIELKKINSNDYYFRGESQKYPEIRASVFRTMAADTSPNKSLKKMLNSFYREIGYDIGAVEKDNLLSFAQHHGLPTNLVDITTSPLTAAFFAAEHSSDKNEGYIYLFEKNNTIVLDELKGIDIKFILEDLKNGDPEVMKYLFNEIDKLDIEYVFQIFYQTLEILIEGKLKYPYDIGSQTPTLDEQSNDDIRYITEFYRNINYKDVIDNIGIHVFSSSDLLQEKIYEPLELSPYFLDYYKRICNTLGLYGDNVFYYNYDLRIWYLVFIEYTLDRFFQLPKLPLFIFKPLISFDRMKSQDGLFFYQNSLDNLHVNFSIQNIDPSLIFVITDQKSMLEELDRIGINRLKLFNDVDNIAGYIKKTFGY